MTTILQSLKLVAATRPHHVPPVVRRRNKLIATLEQQVQAAQARERGEQAKITRSMRKRDRVSGEMREFERSSYIRENWWVADNGQVHLEVRYGVRCLEFAKGKTAILVGERDKLVPTLEMLKRAVENGEFDMQLNNAATRIGKLLKKSTD